ncbi:MAG: archaellin/type IV pilin N-terminal domain-containing protein [Thermoplasmatota archaeon]
MSRPTGNAPRRLLPDDHAQVGIGTMIVFIATVLVAAVAAGVLIDMSGKLQEKSSQTGRDASEQVSSNLAIESVVGLRDAGTDAGLKDLDLYLSLAPGATEVDLAQVKILITNQTTQVTLTHADAADPAAGQFNATSTRDLDGSFTSAAPVMTSGDLVKLTIDLADNSLEIEPRDPVEVWLVPETGSDVAADFTTPTSYGTRTVIHLR